MAATGGVAAVDDAARAWSGANSYYGQGTRKHARKAVNCMLHNSLPQRGFRPQSAPGSVLGANTWRLQSGDQAAGPCAVT